MCTEEAYRADTCTRLCMAMHTCRQTKSISVHAHAQNGFADRHKETACTWFHRHRWDAIPPRRCFLLPHIASNSSAQCIKIKVVCIIPQDNQYRVWGELFPLAETRPFRATLNSEIWRNQAVWHPGMWYKSTAGVCALILLGWLNGWKLLQVGSNPLQNYLLAGCRPRAVVGYFGNGVQKWRSKIECLYLEFDTDKIWEHFRDWMFIALIWHRYTVRVRYQMFSALVWHCWALKYCGKPRGIKVETRGRKLSNPVCVRLKFCPYAQHKYCWLLPHYNGIPSDVNLERIDARIERIRTSTLSDANGDREGVNWPLEWKSWNYDEITVSLE
jgi:hypothetical protein